MTSLFRSRFRPEARHQSLDFNDWVDVMQFGGVKYPVFKQSLSGHQEDIVGSFVGLAQAAYKANGPFFAVCMCRQLLFSEARFQFRERRDGRPGKLFGTAALRPLERPARGQTTSHLLSRMMQDVDLAGEWFGVRRKGGVIRRLRPDWVTVVVGFDDDGVETQAELGDIDAEPIGYLYHPGGYGSGRDPEVLLPEHVAHFAPIPDPLAFFRGMPWITPIVREVMGDKAMTEHKLKFVEQGATPNLVITTEIDDPDEFKKWKELFTQASQGLANAYRNLYFAKGARAEVVGKDLQQVDFKRVQGAGETRIAAAGGVPPVIAGLSEGLEQATYSNYSQARRRYADLTMRPLWRGAAAALETLVSPPSDGSELWYDDRDIPFLQEDVKDTADIQKVQAIAIRQYIDAGFEPDSAVAAVLADDMGLLRHTGLISAQLHDPKKTASAPTPGDDGPTGQPA